MRLLLFNPETEYALASGASFYTPPASVERLRIECQLLPEKWAQEGDVILVDNVNGLKSKFRLVEWSMLESLMQDKSDIKIDPWGWNHALARRLLDYGVPSSCIPDRQTLDAIRALAHRRNTIRLISLWNEKVDQSLRIDLPEELSSEEKCMLFYRCNPGCWLKAPWSSSGRGVINTSADMTEEQIWQWCHGIIRRQGSVIGEVGAHKAADFASEWEMNCNEAKFLGLSSFETSNRGKYICNHHCSQNNMTAQFNKISNMDVTTVVKLQKAILESVFKGYEGPLGVDMIVEVSGKIRPFVEVNVRRTMGMVYLNDA